MRFIILIVLITLCSTAYAAVENTACWEITQDNGKVIKVDDFWHIKNMVSKESILLMRIDDSEMSIPIKSIRAIELVPDKKGGFKFLTGKKSKGTITFIDGSKNTFVTDLDLISRVGEVKSNVPLARVQSITICEEQTIVNDEPKAVTTTETSTQTSSNPDVDVVQLVNGDVLNGFILTRELLWKASFGTIKVNKDQIRKMTLIREKANDGLLESRSSDKINGLLETNKITIKLSIGQTVEVNTSNIKAIRFGKPAR
jgi:hypothetical protein